MEEQREVPLKELKDFCKEENMDFFETSVKNNINLNQAFNKMIELIFQDQSDEDIIKEFGMLNSSLSILSYDSVKVRKKKRSNKNERCC